MDHLKQIKELKLSSFTEAVKAFHTECVEHGSKHNLTGE